MQKGDSSSEIIQKLVEFLLGGGVAEISLLIRGDPGSGKTTFAFELAREINKFFSVLYLSTRVSLQKLMMSCPFLNEIERLDVIDASKNLHVIDSPKEVQTSSLVLSMKYYDGPSFLRTLLYVAKDYENPLVIVDSIEAIEKITKTNIVEELCRISEDLEMGLIFVSEKDRMTENDYIVDGVVELKMEISDGALLRKMVIRKLRGMEIEQPEYLFTLRGRRFRVFEPFSFEIPESPKIFEPLEDPDEDHFSSGSRSLDEIFEPGYSRGSTILFEVGDGVTREMYHPFLEMTIMNFLRNGRSAFVIPSLGSDGRRIRGEILPFVRAEEAERLVLIDERWGRRESEEGEERSLYELISERISELRVSEGVSVMGLDSLSSYYGSGVVGAVEQGVRFTTDTGSLAMIVAKPGVSVLNEVSNLSDIHIKMENICGVPVIRGLKPKTQYYAMVVDTSRGYPRVEFEKIE